MSRGTGSLRVAFLALSTVFPDPTDRPWPMMTSQDVEVV